MEDKDTSWNDANCPENLLAFLVTFAQRVLEEEVRSEGACDDDMSRGFQDVCDRSNDQTERSAIAWDLLQGSPEIHGNVMVPNEKTGYTNDELQALAPGEPTAQLHSFEEP